MAFWTSETLRIRVVEENLIEPFDPGAITHCAYEMAMGSQATITQASSTSGKDRKIILQEREALVIPPGQFGLLLTRERIKVPDDAIGFISIRASKKFDGLVNVSGFHVDPGFCGRLKFSVYNAGSRDIIIMEGDRVFMLWYASLDRRTEDLYRNEKPGQGEIASEDLMRMQGEVASPAQLRKDITDLQHSLSNMKWLVGVLITIAGGMFIRFLADRPTVPTIAPAAVPATQAVRAEPASGTPPTPTIPASRGATRPHTTSTLPSPD